MDVDNEEGDDCVFLATIATFHTQDFSSSTNEELILLKSIIEDNSSRTRPPPPLLTPTSRSSIDRIMQQQHFEPSKMERLIIVETKTLRGENRLKMNFTNLGVPGVHPARFGKNRYGIPNGLCGTNQVYLQPWRVQIKHEGAYSVQNVNGWTVVSVILIRWTITNLISGSTVSMLETTQEAFARDGSGRTICNVVLRKALEQRAAEIEKTLPELKNNPIKLASAIDMIKTLRPKRVTMGILFFGLLHECVQQNFETLIKYDY
jgi:hypothetical protein